MLLGLETATLALEGTGQPSQARRLTPSDGDEGHSAWPTKPNVVLWLVDDQGWGNAGFHNDNVLTPTMDRLALEEGAVLARHYTYPWCAPSRSALMTGIMPHLGLQNDGQRVPESVVMLPQVMKAAGYSTHHIGKWHLGMLRTWQHPTSRGFDTSVGFMNGGEDYVTQRVGGVENADWGCEGVDFLENAKPALGRNGTFSMSWIHSELVRAIYPFKESTTPLFLFVALQAMHSPSPGPELLAHTVDKYAAAGMPDARFAETNAIITMADKLLDHAVELLRETNRWDNTLLIHLSDNGGQITDPKGTHHPPLPGDPWAPQGNNWPLRGMKRSFFEGGVRVPAFVAGGALPSTMRGETLSGYIHLADWFLTIAELADSEIRPSRHGSMSMAGFLDGTRGSPRSGMVLGAGETAGTCNHNEAVIEGNWKLINGSVPCDWATWQAPLFPNASASTSTESRLEQDTKARPNDCVLEGTTFLFNIEDDPNELVNLAASNPKQVALLLTKLAEARADAATDPFEKNHDHAVHDRAALCTAYRDAHGGFLGPYMDGRLVEEVTRIAESRLRDPDPFAFAAPDVYTDEC
jgi:arylsulfatase A-like enzyme